MAGTDRLRERIAEGPAIVLVEPQLGENIGMVARAMANFGLVELRLVAPRDGWPNTKAVSAAASADHVIEAARVYASLDEALADLTFTYATTARPRDGHKPVRGPQEAGQSLRTRHGRGEAVGLIFGRERTGLRNEEIALADEIVTFPVNPAHASLNLAQAVLLMGYEWMQSGLADPTAPAFDGPVIEAAPKEELYGLFAQLEEALDSRGYFRSEGKRAKAVDGLRAVLTRPGLSSSEISVLRGVIASLDRFPRRVPTRSQEAAVEQAAEPRHPRGETNHD